ncbi:hypothetical protein ACIPUC_01210 [Streptomyces sp. LARHCF249]
MRLDHPTRLKYDADDVSVWLMKAGKANEPHRFPDWKRGGYCAVGFNEVKEEIPAGLPDDHTGKQHIRQIVARWLAPADVGGATGSLFNFCARMKLDDLVVVWRDGDGADGRGLLHFGIVTGPLQSEEITPGDYPRRRSVRWFGQQPCPDHLRSSVARQHPTVEFQNANGWAFRALADACADAPAADADPVTVGRMTLVPYTAPGGVGPVTQAAPSATDARKMTWANAEHRKLLTGLADEAVRRGMRVWLGRDQGHVYDVLWNGGGELTLCEVKSLTGNNDPDQLRMAIGQLIDYADDFRPKKLAQLAETEPAIAGTTTLRRVLWVSGPPQRAKHWTRACASAGIMLGWPGMEDAVFPGGEGSLDAG